MEGFSYLWEFTNRLKTLKFLFCNVQNKSFIFWLFNKDKKAVYFDKIIREANGILKTNGQPAHLEYAPDGWKDILVKYGRNIKYLGLFRDFTVPMNFKKDGARIVRDVMWKLGMEAVIYLGVSKLNRTVYPPKYEPWYSGELDFSKFVQTKSNININVMEGGLSKYLKAFENTTYEIDVDADSEAQIVVMDGFPFANKIEYTIYDPQVYTPIKGSTSYTIGIGIISQEGSTQGILNLDQSMMEFSEDRMFMEVSDKYITARVSGTLDLKTLDHPRVSMIPNIFIVKIDADGGHTDYVITNTLLESNSYFNFPFDFDIPLEPGDRLYLATKLPDDDVTLPTYVEMFKIRGTTLNVEYEVTFKQTYIKALKPLRLFQKIVEKMTEGRYTASSAYLESMTDILITSGSAIRNHEGENPTVTGSKIKTSLDEFFQAFRIKGIGLGIENDKIIIEKTSYFFKSGISMELGEVSELEIMVAEDLVFNTIKAGYPNQTYDEVNGKDEFNVTQNYTTPHTRIVKELDLVSPYRADAYGIELTRLNLDGKDTTDNSADNDTFLLNVKQGGTYIYYSGNLSYNANGAGTITIPEVAGFMNGHQITIAGSINNGTYTVINTSYLVVGSTILTVSEPLDTGEENAVITAESPTLYMLNRPDYSSITGLLHPEKMFNIELSPKRILLNNSDYIHSVLDYQDANFIKFQSGEKNSELSTTLSGLTITEKADIQIAQLPAKLFRPYYFTFKVPTDFNFLKTVAASPYSKIGFTYNGEKYYGYLFDGGVQPATRDVQQIKLLCAPETNLSQLIEMI